MDMRLRDANQPGESSLRQFAVTNLTPDVRQQLQLSVLVSQIGVSPVFQFEIG
jgi:hypothetical protein